MFLSPMTIPFFPPPRVFPPPLGSEGTTKCLDSPSPPLFLGRLVNSSLFEVSNRSLGLLSKMHLSPLKRAMKCRLLFTPLIERRDSPSSCLDPFLFFLFEERDLSCLARPRTGGAQGGNSPFTQESISLFLGGLRTPALLHGIEHPPSFLSHRVWPSERPPPP